MIVFTKEQSGVGVTYRRHGLSQLFNRVTIVLSTLGRFHTGRIEMSNIIDALSRCCINATEVQ